MYQKKQSQLEILYQPDYEGLQKFFHPHEAQRERIKRNSIKAQKKKAWADWTWVLEQEVTGMIENDSSIWLHPPRSNQYVYCYLSAYPQVEYNELKTDGHWESVLKIFKGIPSNAEFVGTIEQKFRVTGQTAAYVGNMAVPDSWIIEAVGTHSSLGENYTTIIFDKGYYGFISMNFTYYNGKKISLILSEVTVE